MDLKQFVDFYEYNLSQVKRPGMDRLIAYLRKSDFYTAPASTRYHLSIQGGLVIHSLDVLQAFQGLLFPSPQDASMWEMTVANRIISRVPFESMVVFSLLHDICKTYFYKPGVRNVRNEATGQWDKVPTFTVDDRMPLGHGPKSVMIIKQYIPLSSEEMYAIWWHMGPPEGDEKLTYWQAVDKHPFILFAHMADTLASHVMETSASVKDLFLAQGNQESQNAPSPAAEG